MQTTTKNPTRRDLLSALDVLAAHTLEELEQAERLALTIAAVADQAAARLQELAGLRNQIQAACAIADDSRPSPLRRHRPTYGAVQVA